MLTKRNIFAVAFFLFTFFICSLKAFPAAENFQKYTFKKGDTLWGIAQKRYGNRHYADLIASSNHIDPAQLQAGQLIHTPDFDDMIDKAGLNVYLQDTAPYFQNIVTRYHEMERRLYDHQISVSDKNTLTDLAGKVDLIINALEKNTKNKSAPQKMIGQLLSLKVLLVQLAHGDYGLESYNIDMVHQRIVNALLNGMEWAKFKTTPPSR